MIHVRIISDYPADPDLTGWPAETTDVTIRLPREFAPNAGEAHAKIQALIEAGEFFDIPSVDEVLPFEFAPELIREVVVWEGRGKTLRVRICSHLGAMHQRLKKSTMQGG